MFCNIKMFRAFVAVNVFGMCIAAAMATAAAASAAEPATMC